MTASKLSMLSLIATLFRAREIRKGCIILGILSLSLFAAIVVLFFLLPPIAQMLKIELGAFQINTTGGYVFPGVASTILNGMIGVIPLEKICKMKMKTGQKIRTLGVFSMGFM